MLRSALLIGSMASVALSAVANFCAEAPFREMQDFRDFQPAVDRCALHYSAQTITKTLPNTCLTSTKTVILGTSTVHATNHLACPTAHLEMRDESQLEARDEPEGYAPPGYGPPGYGPPGYGPKGYGPTADGPTKGGATGVGPTAGGATGVGPTRGGATGVGPTAGGAKHHHHRPTPGGYEHHHHRPTPGGYEHHHHRPTPGGYEHHPHGPPPGGYEHHHPRPTGGYGHHHPKPYPTGYGPPPGYSKHPRDLMDEERRAGPTPVAVFKRDAEATKTAEWSNYYASLAECGYNCIQTACSCVGTPKVQLRTPVPTCTSTLTKETVVHETKTIEVAPEQC